MWHITFGYIEEALTLSAFDLQSLNFKFRSSKILKPSIRFRDVFKLLKIQKLHDAAIHLMPPAS